jgi:hypothetical protein
MGSYFELNDTLRISQDQGFPAVLDINIHLKTPYNIEDFENKVFEFTNKEGIRVYHQPPVRCFLVEFLNGKWLYWGLCHIIEIKHDYIKGTTSGKYKIIYINTPDEMIKAHDLIDRNPETNYFK